MYTTIRKLHHHFGTEILNVRISNKDSTQRRIDKNLHQYGHLYRSFVNKRRINRSQIWPKIHILDQTPSSQLPHLSYQKLFSMKTSMKDQMMQTIANNDPSKINSSFIISTFTQDYFKQLMDQYVDKVLVCGKAPCNQQQQQVESKVLELYRVFFYGQKNTPLERQIQQAYLSAKQYKYRRYKSQKVIPRKQMLQCTWTQQDQRLMEQLQNWPAVDSNLSDINHRNFYVPLEQTSRLPHRIKFQQLYKSWTWLDKLRFNWGHGRYFNAKSPLYYNWLVECFISRIIKYIKSVQFKTCLNIPHDYMIEAQMTQIHFWLVIDRLKKIGTLPCQMLAKQLEFALNYQTVQGAQSVNLKKSNLLVASLERMLQTNSSILQVHFNVSPLTKNNPIKAIDAMVWSIAFAEKVHRFSDEVYLFSDYLLQNFLHMQNHSERDLLNGVIEFDPYLISPHYRQEIERVNPPLSQAQFQKQLNSKEAQKSYYYSNTQKVMQQQMTPNYTLSPSKKIDTSFSLSELLQPIVNLRLKYYSLKTMDHFNKMEEIQRQNQKIEKKGVWKSQKDELQNIQTQFSTLQTLKNQRRKISAQTKIKSQ